MTDLVEHNFFSFVQSVFKLYLSQVEDRTTIISNENHVWPERERRMEVGELVEYVRDCTATTCAVHVVR